LNGNSQGVALGYIKSRLWRYVIDGLVSKGRCRMAGAAWAVLNRAVGAEEGCSKYCGYG